jgi:hypothetical protein
MIAIALIAGVVVGYLGRGLFEDPGARAVDSPEAGTVVATWSCESIACPDGRAWPALVFSQGSCPRFTILMGNGSDDVIRGVLPAGRYDISILLTDNQMTRPVKHRNVKVGAGTTTDLGVMTVDPNVVPYPAFCD